MKEKTKKEFCRGIWVAVRADLTNDPAGMQGKLGRIVSINENDEVIVRFPEEDYTAKYNQDALITLAPKSVILTGLTTNYSEITQADQKLILSVLQDLMKGKYASGLTTAINNDNTLFYCTKNLDQWIELKEHYFRSKSQKPSR